MKKLMAMVVMGMAAAGVASAQAGGWSVQRAVKVGGEGGFDYVVADSEARRLYVPRLGAQGRITVFKLDAELKPEGVIEGVSAHGVAIDHASGHGFASSNPVTMFDTEKLKVIKTIAVQGEPDGIMAADGRVYVFSHEAPNVTVLDAKDGSIVGTVDLGGAPEAAVSDGAHVYVDLEDKGAIGVFDVKTLKLVATYSLQGKGDGCAGLALDAAKGVLFATCRSPKVMVMVQSSDGTVLGSVPIGGGTDGAVFDAATGEAISANGEGTLTVVKQDASGAYAVEQTVQTKLRAKTIALDEKKNKLYLVTADFTPPPANAPMVNGRPARGAMVPESCVVLEVGR